MNNFLFVVILVCFKSESVLTCELFTSEFKLFGHIHWGVVCVITVSCTATTLHWVNDHLSFLNEISLSSAQQHDPDHHHSNGRYSY